MAFDLSSISSETQMRAPRIILLGVPKIGKSTWAAGAAGAVFLPVDGEEGIDDIAANKIPEVISDIPQLYGWFHALQTGKHDHKTVVVDSTSALEPLVWAETCRQHHVDSIEKVLKGWGKGYSEAMKTWRMMTKWLDALRTDRGMGCILIGHVTVKTFIDPEVGSYNQWRWNIHEKAASFLYGWADVILFCNTKVVVKDELAVDISGGGRFLYTQERPAHPGGGRGVYGRLPYELPLSYAHWAAAVAAETSK